MRKISPTYHRHTLVALAWLLLSAVAGCSPAEENSPVSAAVGEFRLPTLDGRRVGPPDFSGQVVLVDFWATWCAPCHIQAEILRALYDEFRNDGVQFLAVSVGEEMGVVRRFASERPFPYPVLVDSEDELSVELGIVALPTIMILDRQGTIRYLEPGISMESRLRQALRDAGAG